eukprot:TRINITY_DN961_c1_g1_i1.p1 TRINITY_DN961_c1_g1~~TRINITY_DN961_c1_g1_i1.p1  ORF type:complete len:328 (+),score=39.43 TRINITY_DN961_c1_g1_i1:37-1020(+)
MSWNPNATRRCNSATLLPGRRSEFHKESPGLFKLKKVMGGMIPPPPHVHDLKRCGSGDKRRVAIGQVKKTKSPGGQKRVATPRSFTSGGLSNHLGDVKRFSRKPLIVNIGIPPPPPPPPPPPLQENINPPQWQLLSIVSDLSYEGKDDDSDDSSTASCPSASTVEWEEDVLVEPTDEPVLMQPQILIPKASKKKPPLVAAYPLLSTALMEYDLEQKRKKRAPKGLVFEDTMHYKLQASYFHPKKRRDRGVVKRNSNNASSRTTSPPISLPISIPLRLSATERQYSMLSATPRSPRSPRGNKARSSNFPRPSSLHSIPGIFDRRVRVR